MEFVLELDKTLFEDFVIKKSTPLATTMRQGVLDSGIDWNEASRPTGRVPFFYCVWVPSLTVSVFAVHHRGSRLHVRNSDVIGRDPRAS